MITKTYFKKIIKTSAKKSRGHLILTVGLVENNYKNYA